MAKKGNKGTFGAGRKSTGRPKGVLNKATATIKSLAEPYSAEAIETYVGIMRDTQAPHAARIAAARELIDRGHGKAKESLELTAQMRPLVVDMLQPGESLLIADDE
jgi:hypothetical protein